MLIFVSVVAKAATVGVAVPDSIVAVPDTSVVRKPNPLVTAYRFVEKMLFDVDTTYIDPGDHNFQTLLMNSNTYEIYRLTDNDGNSIRFSPEMSMKIGPYVGYGPIFLGYTIDVAHLQDRRQREDMSLSLYSLPAGIDIYYRRSGDNFRIRELYLGDDVDASPMINQPFDGLTSKIIGANAYYIFNHRRFSYPAAFNQSTVQRQSAGSWLAGVGYTHHSLSVDWQKLNTLTQQRLGQDVSDRFNDHELFKQITYTDVSLSCGYGYNWVFSKNWLFASSLSLALAYKRSVGETRRDLFAITLRDFSFENFNIDGIGRFGIVWNRGRWFAGASVIAHSYNYKKKNFYTNNSFGNLDIYAGFNFW